MKHCEVCLIQIPDDYGNTLCDKCYKLIESGKIEIYVPSCGNNGVTDPNYQENEQKEELDMVSRMHGRFKGIGIVIPQEQRTLYTAIKDWIRNECVTKNIQYPKFIWKPKVIDVGCGVGIGTNILSQEADYILGIDKNEESIRFAQQLFTREKNNIYWSTQVDFMEVDVTTETREFVKFDILVCAEVFEHLKESKKLLEFLKKLMNNKSTLFISTPNRNADKIGKDKPNNEYHVFEPTSQEFKNTLSSYFSKVELLDFSLNPVSDDTNITPIVAKVSL